jgi:aminoglycoside 6'-N-acetyltransferase I
MCAATASIHVVSAANASLLDNVDEDVFDNKVQPALLQAFLANPANLMVVAVAEGQVVGMATAICYVHPDKPLAMFINEVGVSQRAQGQGIGKRLVSVLLEKARGRGCTEAWVATELSNKPARALYQSLGGVPDEEHAVVYVYPLSSNAGAHAGDA